MESIRKFPFAFPSLKTLSMISVGQQLAKVKRGGFCCFPCHIERDIYSSLCPSKLVDGGDYGFHVIVKELPMPLVLIPELSIVLAGMHKQVSYWVKSCKLLHYSMYKEMDIVFNLYGIFDESETWKLYLQRKIADVQDKHILLRILYLACNLRLSSELEGVLNKLSVLAEDEEIQFNAGCCSYLLKLYYGIRNTPEPLASYDAFKRLNPKRRSTPPTEVTERMTTMHSFNKCMRYISARHNTAFERVIMQRYDVLHDSSLLADGLKVLNGENRSLYPDTVHILKGFLMWPYVQVFPKLVAKVHNALSFCDYCSVFDAIVEKMPSVSSPDILYGQLLKDYWYIIPPNVKERMNSLSVEDCIDAPSLFGASQKLQRKNTLMYSLMFG